MGAVFTALQIACQIALRLARQHALLDLDTGITQDR
jgi:hypothetical protein